MKKTVLFVITLLMISLFIEAAFAAGDVKINATNFPDAVFRNYVSEKCDKNKNGTLSQTEIEKTTELNISNADIKDLTGIEHFTNLNILSCGMNYLTKLDLRKNTKLTELDCYNNQITNLDISKNTKLTRLSCGSNQLTSLNVSKNKALLYLDCGSNQIRTLNLTANTELTDLYCYENRLTKLDLRKNTKLKEVMCYNNSLTSLNLSQNAKLEGLSCGNNKLKKLNLNGCTHLRGLSCDNNQLLNLDVSKCIYLSFLNCENNQLTYLDISKCTSLTDLHCSSNHLTSLDISKNKAINNVSCSNNRIEYTTVDGTIPYKDLPHFDISKVSNIEFIRYFPQGKYSKGKTAFIVANTCMIAYNYMIRPGQKEKFAIDVTYLQTKISSVTLPKSTYIYTGEPIEAKVTVKAKINGKNTMLEENTDYIVTYKNNIKAGTATVTVKGINHYTGSISKEFIIKPVKILKVTLSNTSLPYTGKERKPIPTVTTKVNGQLVTLSKKTDYTVKYENNIEVGTATVIIAGKGNYTGTITKTFKIIEK